VLEHAVDDHVLAEGDAFKLGRDLGVGDAGGVHHRAQVGEQRLGRRLGQQGGGAFKVADVLGAGQVHLVQALDHRHCAVAQALAVAFEHQQLVVVEGQQLTAVVGLVERLADEVVVGVLAHRAAGDVDLDDAVGTTAVAAILDQRALHEAEQRGAVRRDGQAFYALVSVVVAVSCGVSVNGRLPFGTGVSAIVSV
jgi:hypothetical protein